jgi:hypothetical protein
VEKIWLERFRVQVQRFISSSGATVNARVSKLPSATQRRRVDFDLIQLPGGDE